MDIVYFKVITLKTMSFPTWTSTSGTTTVSRTDNKNFQMKHTDEENDENQPTTTSNRSQI